MRERLLWAIPCIGGAVGIVVACSSTGHPPPSGTAPPYDSGVVTDTGLRADVVTAKDTGSADVVPEGASDDGGNEAGPSLPECSETATWSTIASVSSVPSASFARFGSISASEQTVAWSDSTGAVFIADRSGPGVDFGAPAALPAGPKPLANDRVAVNPTGTELVATLADGSSFTTFLRPSQGQPWQAGSVAPFVIIAATISESGGAFSEPVLSADGLSLFYLLAIGNHLPVFYESAWDATTKTWALGTPLTGPDFGITDATQLRRPTGAASDRLTLFFYDEEAGNERAAWREFPTSPFTFFEDLPLVPEAAPNGDCLTLYFASGADSEAEAGAAGLATAQ